MTYITSHPCRLALLLLALCLSLGASAQTKVVEKSAKKVPDWLKTVPENSLVVTVTGATLAEAQDRALAEIMERILQAVAVNVSLTQTNLATEIYKDGKVQSVDAYNRQSRIKAANLPCLKGVSLSKAEDIYWRRLQDKSTKEEHYEYSVKYPFTRKELKLLQAEFEEQDAEMVAQTDELERTLHVVDAVEDIAQRLAQLNTLEEYFFDEVRLGRVRGLKEQYRLLYDALSITGNFTSASTYECQMLLEGKAVSVSTPPKVTSNCASQITAKPTDDGRFAISYNTDDCLGDDENYLNIVFRIDTKRVTHKAYLAQASQVVATTFSVVAEGKIILIADSVDTATRTLHNLNIRLTLNNRGDTPFGLKSIELTVPEISAPIVFDNIDAVYRTKGVIQVQALAEGDFHALETKATALGFVNGALTLVNPLTNAIERIRIALPYTTNWEQAAR